MQLNMMKSKIHRATVTEANLNYIGSITIDSLLMEASGLLEYEKVQVVDVNNGNRFETYVIKGAPGEGTICLNGAAARLVHPGDAVIVMSFGILNHEEALSFHPKVVFVDSKNKIKSVNDKEEMGTVLCE